MKNKVKFICYVLFFVLLLFSVKMMMPKVISEVYPTFIFSNGTITESIEGFGYEIDTSSLTPTLKINNGGTYIIQGSSNEGSIVVDKGIRNVKLVLEDFALASSNTAPIIIGKESRVSIQLVGDSTLTDNENQENETSDDPLLKDAYEGAAIKIKSGGVLKLFGTGTLNIEGNSKNGIKGSNNSYLEIHSGTYNITSSNDGISIGESIIIHDGNITIQSDSDGISSDGEIIIENGDFHITTFNGYNTEGFYKDTMSAKAIKATGKPIDGETVNKIIITGGEFHLNSRDDAIHSDGDLEITRGSLEIYSGDDALHADGDLTIGQNSSLERDPEITIVSNFEGIEGGNVSIYNGKIQITSVDDGINSKGIYINNHRLGGNTTIYGGKLYIDSTSDGIDSNYDLIISGGELTIFSDKAGSDNTPLDSSRFFNINNATVFAAGSNLTNIKPTYGSQAYIDSREEKEEGTTINIINNNEVVYTDITHRRTNYIFYTSPNLNNASITEGEIIACKNCSFEREWTEEIIKNPTLEEAGKIKYTSNCREIEYKTIPKLQQKEEIDIPEQFRVTFETDDYSSVNVYYTQDFSIPDVENATSTIARNIEIQEPLGDGTDQVNFCIILEEPYQLKSVTTNNNNYNQMKNLENNCYRITKIIGDITVTVQTKGLLEDSVTVKTSNTTKIVENDIFEKIPYQKIFTYKDFMDSVEITSYSIVVKNALGETVTNNKESLGTKSKLQLETTDYTIIVEGDINQDGKISSMDYVMIKNHIMETSRITDRSLIQASDMNKDNKISSLDYVTVKKIIMGEM